jgi:hypothetical protein
MKELTSQNMVYISKTLQEDQMQKNELSIDVGFGQANFIWVIRKVNPDGYQKIVLIGIHNVT